MLDHSAHSWTHPNSWWELCSYARDLCPANSRCRQTDMRKCCTLHHSGGFQTWLGSCSTDISLILSPAPSQLQLLMVEPTRNINLWVIHEFCYKLYRSIMFINKLSFKHVKDWNLFLACVLKILQYTFDWKFVPVRLNKWLSQSACEVVGLLHNIIKQHTKLFFLYLAIRLFLTMFAAHQLIAKNNYNK